MLNNFRSYQLSVSFYRHVSKLALPSHLKDQLLRAASSVSLNLAEGSPKRYPADQRRFYSIAFGSLRECQAILELAASDSEQLKSDADTLAAHINKLIRSRS